MGHFAYVFRNREPAKLPVSARETTPVVHPPAAPTHPSARSAPVTNAPPPIVVRPSPPAPAPPAETGQSSADAEVARTLAALTMDSPDTEVIPPATEWWKDSEWNPAD